MPNNLLRGVPTLVEQPKAIGSLQRAKAVSDIDSQDTAGVTISAATQRTDENIVDIVGTLFRSTSSTVGLTSVHYSTIGASGPWTLISALPTDSAYLWPSGSAAGDAFNVPVEFSSDPGTQLYWKVTADWT